MANYGNEYAEPSDIARKGGPVTKQNVSDAYDQLMFIKVVSLLLGNQDCNDEGISVERSRDLGRLFFFFLPGGGKNSFLNNVSYLACHVAAILKRPYSEIFFATKTRERFSILWRWKWHGGMVCHVEP